jgi:hypothetical protein
MVLKKQNGFDGVDDGVTVRRPQSSLQLHATGITGMSPIEKNDGRHSFCSWMEPACARARSVTPRCLGKAPRFGDLDAAGC